jgi:DNA mismatch endonuclease (patch repair protein)
MGAVESVESWASSPATRRSMRANRSRDTKPELAVRKLLHAQGLRYRVAYRPLPDNRRATVDIAFPGAHVVVLIDGCFWHGCPEHYRPPHSHQDYWQDKLTRNVERDRRTDQALAQAGWRVLRYWEHDQPEAVASQVERAVRAALEDRSRRRAPGGRRPPPAGDPGVPASDDSTGHAHSDPAEPASSASAPYSPTG